MNFQQLRYVVALAELGSFLKAAERCHVTQPTLSVGIASLERQLGGALFERSTREVRLSALGERLLPAVRDVLAAQSNLLLEAKRKENESLAVLRLGVSPLIGVRLLSGLAAHRAGTLQRAEFVLREKNLSELISALEGGRMEYAFGPILPKPTKQRKLHSLPLWKEPLVLVARPNPHIRRIGKADAIPFRELAGETFAMVPDSCGLTQVVRQMFARLGIALREHEGEAVSYEALQDWAELGLGSAILPLSKVAPGREYAKLLGPGGRIVEISYGMFWTMRQESAILHAAFLERVRKAGPVLMRGGAVRVPRPAGSSRKIPVSFG